MKRSYFVCCLLASALMTQLAVAQQSGKLTQPAEGAASPEMDRLAKAIGGDWTTAESMERREVFPNGGSHHLPAGIPLVVGGARLVAVFHSDGFAGELGGLLL